MIHLSTFRYPALPEALSHRYFAVRHAEAHSNVEAFLCSDCSSDRGLTEHGRWQAEACAAQLAPLLTGLSVQILSSPLPRAFQSAQLIHRQLAGCCILAPEILIRDGLRERQYGELEGSSADLWHDLIRADRSNPANCYRRAESVTAFIERLSGVIQFAESFVRADAVVLVTHCDLIQGFEALFSRTNPSHYSQIGQLGLGCFSELIPSPIK